MRKARGSGRLMPVIAAVLCLAPVSAAAQQENPEPRSAEPVHWSLGDVVAAALANHPSVGQADAQVRAAAARREQAAAATRPQVDGTAAWSWSEATSRATGVRDRATGTSVEGSVSQLITDFGRTRATLAGAGELTAAAGESARSSRVEVVYAAEVAYFDVLRAASLQLVRRETVRQREALLRQARAFYEAGVKARIDVVRAEANLYQARADNSGADHALQTARLVLLNRMGVDGPADFELVGAPEVVEAAGTVEDWRREAEKNHPDLGALRLRLAAARSDRLATGRGNNPVVTAGGSVGWTGIDELPADREWSIGARVSVPVFDGRLTRQQTAEAEAQVLVAEFALRDRLRQIRLQVEQADQAIKDAAERLAAREKEREAFAENLRLATGRYEAGAADIIEMVDAQVQMTTAETNLVQARFDQGTALAALYRSLGRQ